MKLCPKKKRAMESSLSQLIGLLSKFSLISITNYRVFALDRRNSVIRRSIEARRKGRFK